MFRLSFLLYFRNSLSCCQFSSVTTCVWLLILLWYVYHFLPLYYQHNLDIVCTIMSLHNNLCTYTPVCCFCANLDTFEPLPICAFLYQLVHFCTCLCTFASICGQLCPICTLMKRFVFVFTHLYVSVLIWESVHSCHMCTLLYWCTILHLFLLFAKNRCALLYSLCWSLAHFFYIRMQYLSCVSSICALNCSNLCSPT